MKKQTGHSDLFIILLVFVVSRLALYAAGVSFGYDALFEYWQYLDVGSLRHNLLNSLWNQHSQPPFFNFFMGILLKAGGDASPLISQIVFLLISLLNGWLILRTTRRITSARWLPLILSMVYLLDPATMLYENELFYTSFVSLLLLVVVYLLVFTINGRLSAWVFLPLALLSLTKASYHLVWLVVAAGIILYSQRRSRDFRQLVLAASMSTLLVGGWYMKNYLIFGTFASSSWMGINLSRIVYQGVTVDDSSTIAAIHPFYPIQYYRPYISSDYLKYAGRNDRVLLSETKNEDDVNMNHAGYLEVSNQLRAASLARVAADPFHYFKNVAASALIFFTPASSYFKLDTNAYKIRFYDAVAGENFAHFISDRKDQKLALALAAIPNAIVYGYLFLATMGYTSRQRKPFLGFILFTFLFVFITSSLLEYGENMRFRYEVHPLFLILAAVALEAKRKGGTHSEPV